MKPIRVLAPLPGLFCLLALLAAPAPAPAQGLYWETKTSLGMGGNDTIDTKSFYLPRKFKQGSATDAVVFLLDTRMMYSIDYDAKEYSEVTFDELEAHLRTAGTKLRAQMAELQAQMDSLPEDQRKMVEQMMGGKMTGVDTGSVEVVKSKETKTIAGFACTKYLLMRGAEEAASVWTTSALPDFAGMQKDFREFSAMIAGQMSLNGAKMAQAMKKIEGFPVQTIIGRISSTVTMVETRSVGGSEFEVPEDFKKVPFKKRMGEGLEEMDDGEGEDDDDGG